MRCRACLALLPLLVGLAACGEQPPTDGRHDDALPDGPFANVIETDPLTPVPIHLTPADLPAPYHSASASQSARVVAMPEAPRLQVPDGFTVNVYASRLDGPRRLVLSPDGDVLVAESRANRIRRLRDTDGDGSADGPDDVHDVFADAANALDKPFGMVFTADALFIAGEGAVRRYPFAPGQTRLEGTGTVVTTLPTGGHWTRNLALSPDGRQLYVAIGSATNVDPEPLPRASVQVMNLDGSDQRTFAHGLRNPVGLAFHPTTGALYTTVNERDRLGDDLVPDYLTRLQEGAFYGWPYAYLTPDRLDPRRLDDGRSERPDLAAQTRTPDVLFQAHSAALGLAFYDATAFPERYRGGAFVAFHGSWNRNPATGYKVVFVPFDAAGRPTGAYEDFLTGFLSDPAAPTTWARPVDLLVLPDGSLLISEDGNGRLLRVTYTG